MCTNILTERVITKLLKSFKTEISPTTEQKNKINRTIGTCRFIYNFYLAHNREIYEQENRFVSGYDFSIWLNNDYIPNNPEFSWIKEVSSKSVKQSIMNAQKAFKNFFDKKTNFPKWKKKSNSDVKMYFVKTDSKAMIFCERHRVKYSPPIEAGASFNPPNLTEDFILRASVSEAMGFL